MAPLISAPRLRFIAGVGGTLGLVMVLSGLFLMSSNISFPLTPSMIAALLWMVLGGAGALALLACSHRTSSIPRWLIGIGLLCGNAMASIAVLMAPISFVAVFIFIAISAMVLADLYGKKAALAFALLPVVALLAANLRVFR